MTSSYKHLALEDAMPGMILSDDLLDGQGHMLLPQGVILTETMLTLLRRHQIELLPVLCGTVSAADEAAELERRQQRLTQLFRKYDANKEEAVLFPQYVQSFRLGAST